MSSYQLKHRNYYEKNKERLNAAESEKKRWLNYYENNKERILEKRRLRRQGLQQTPSAETQVDDGTNHIISLMMESNV